MWWGGCEVGRLSSAGEGRWRFLGVERSDGGISVATLPFKVHVANLDELFDLVTNIYIPGNGDRVIGNFVLGRKMRRYPQSGAWTGRATRITPSTSVRYSTIYSGSWTISKVFSQSVKRPRYKNDEVTLMMGFPSWIMLSMTLTALPASALMTEAIFASVVTMSPT